MSHVDSPVEQEWTIDFLWAIGRYILGCNQLEREQLIDPKLVERHDSYLWLIDKFYQWLIKMTQGSDQERSIYHQIKQYCLQQYLLFDEFHEDMTHIIWLIMENIQMNLL